MWESNMKHTFSMIIRGQISLALHTSIFLGWLVSGPIVVFAQGEEFSLFVKNDKAPIASKQKVYFSSEAVEKPAYIRISDAKISFTESSDAILYFQASTTTNARFPDRETAPAVSIRFLGQNGENIGPWVNQVAVATIGTCKGHESHTIDITGSMADDLFRAAAVDATSFRIKVSEAKKVYVC